MAFEVGVTYLGLWKSQLKGQYIGALDVEIFYEKKNGNIYF